MRGKIFLITLLCTALLIALAAALFNAPVPKPAVTGRLPQMDPRRAYENIENFVTRFPQRSIYHPQNREAALWLEDQLKQLGLHTVTQEFNSWAGDRLAEGLLNVYGMSIGSKYPAEIILVTTHLDIPEFVYQGAADAGSDAGIILELARVFSRENHARTIIYLFTNNEEYGMQGAVTFVEQFQGIGRVRAVLAMDYMNMGELDYILVRFTGLQKGFTPLWLREMAVAAASQEGPVRSIDPFMEWVERAVTIASTDTGVFLRAGIPAVNLTSRAIDLDWQRRIYHSTADTFDKIELDTVAAYGRTAEKILRSMDEMETIPAGGMTYFKYSPARYLPGWTVTMMQLLLFAPLGAVVAADRRRQAGRLGRGFRRSGLKALFLFLSGATGYLVLRLLPGTNLMVRYPLYPATQKDPVLYNPQYLPALLVLAAMLVIGLLLLKGVYPRLARSPERYSAAEGEAARWWILLLLGLLALTVWAEGSGFAAAIFFLLPAYLWPWVKPAAGVPRRLFNLLLALAGGTIFFVFISIFAATYQIGVMWWYIMLASAFGLFSPKVVLVFLASTALLIATADLGLRRSA